MTVRATINDNGRPAGVVHAERDDNAEVGRPTGPVCGTDAGLRYFLHVEFEQVPVELRCPACIAALDL